MTNVIDLSGKRTPVIYSVHVTHHWDGVVEVQVDGVQDDPRSRKCVADALLTAAELVERGHAA